MTGLPYVWLDGATHRHAPDPPAWREHDHLGGGRPHAHDPAGYQVALPALDAVLCAIIRGLPPAPAVTGLDLGRAIDARRALGYDCALCCQAATAAVYVTVRLQVPDGLGPRWLDLCWLDYGRVRDLAADWPGDGAVAARLAELAP